MDSKPYKAINDLYKFIDEKNGVLDPVDISYITGILKTLVDLFYDSSDDEEVPVNKPFKIQDIFKA